jgi:hypothetical protein
MEPPERASARMMEACRTVLNPASSLGLHFYYFKKLLVHNKTNDGIVFHVVHQKTIVSKAFRLTTKSTMVLSFLQITKKMFQKSSDSQQNQQWYCLSCGSPKKLFEKTSGSKQNPPRSYLFYGPPEMR